MNQIYALKLRWLEIYGSKSKYIDMGMKFIVGLMIFSYINGQIGYMSAVNNFGAVMGLALVCTILPFGGMMAIALLVTLLHVFTLSMVLAGCLAVIFLILFIVYFRFTADQSVVVVLTPVALSLGIPIAVPVVCGLLVGPMAIIPMSVGAIIYSLIKEVSLISDSLNGELSLDGILEDAIAFMMQIKDNKEIMFYIIVMGITTVVVFLVKKIQVPHAWKIAVGSGYVVALIVSLIVNPILGAGVSFVAIVLGNLFAVIIGLVVEVFFLGVDYKKTEVVEFEDDNYHYYVKMVPKLDGGRKTSKRRKKQVIKEIEENIEEEYSEEEYSAEETFDDTFADEEFDMEALFNTESIDSERGMAYEMDADFEQGSTMIIDSEDIERELRSNAHEKSMKSEENMSKHLAANYEMLKKSFTGNKRSKKNRKK